jgi:Coenzyme PQQ synthesis protein D (PqqD)
VVSRGSTVVAAKDQVSSDLGGEVAILDLKAGVYYGLDAVGARIWSLIQEPRTVNEIRDILLEEYEVEPERCERDLLVLLQSLADEGIIEVEA